MQKLLLLSIREIHQDFYFPLFQSYMYRYITVFIPSALRMLVIARQRRRIEHHQITWRKHKDRSIFLSLFLSPYVCTSRKYAHVSYPRRSIFSILSCHVRLSSIIFMPCEKLLDMLFVIFSFCAVMIISKRTARNSLDLMVV